MLLIIAHRCLMKSLTGNLLESFIKCSLNSNISGIEIDLAEDKLGNLVVAHPGLIDSITGVFSGVAVPFTEYLKVASPKTIYLDIKGYKRYGARKIYKLKEVLENTHTTTKIIVLSRDNYTLKVTKELLPYVDAAKLNVIENNYFHNRHQFQIFEVPLSKTIYPTDILGSNYPKYILKYQKLLGEVSIMINSYQEIDYINKIL